MERVYMGLATRHKPLRLRRTSDRLHIGATFTLKLWERTEYEGLYRLVATRVNHNIMCNGGLALLAAAINWSAIQDQNATWGSPFTASNIYTLYGAVGTSATAPLATDTQLTAELGRVVVSFAATSGAVITWSFFFGLTQAVGTIAEAGAFGMASATANSGTIIDHVLISPTVVKTNAQVATLQLSFTLSS